MPKHATGQGGGLTELCMLHEIKTTEINKLGAAWNKRP